MGLEVISICPLGSVCEQIKDNKIYRCCWYKHLVGKNPQTGEDMNEHDCAIGWLPLLMVENASTNRGQTAALESFRNEMVVNKHSASALLSSLLYSGNNIQMLEEDK